MLELTQFTKQFNFLCYFDFNFLLQCQELKFTIVLRNVDKYKYIDKYWISITIKGSTCYIYIYIYVQYNFVISFLYNYKKYLGHNVYTKSNHVTFIYFCFYYFKFLLTWPCVCRAVRRWLML